MDDPRSSFAERAQLLEAASACRCLLERLLASSGLEHLRSRPAGACLFGCILLAEMLPRATGGVAVIRGGDGVSDGAYIDAHGRSHGHYWCELHASAVAPRIVDITADQFDSLAEPARVWCTTDPVAIARYRSGDWSTVDAHVADFLRSLPAAASLLSAR